MKTSILIATLLLGAGLATSNAGGAFEINVDNPGPPALHYGLEHQPLILHGNLKALHRQAYRERRHEAEHGVPKWVRTEQHRALHYALKQHHHHFPEQH